MTDNTTEREIARNTQKQLDAHRMDRLRDTETSLSTTDSSYKDERWTGRLNIAKVFVNGGIVGIPKVTAAIMPKDQQEAAQKMIMLAQGVAGVANMLIAASDKARKANKLASNEQSLKNIQKEIAREAAEYQQNYGQQNQQGSPVIRRNFNGIANWVTNGLSGIFKKDASDNTTTIAENELGKGTDTAKGPTVKPTDAFS